MEKPLVSIVSPIYGVERFIGECLESLFQQTYKNIEFVFVNDKTPDNSMSILNQMIEKYVVKNAVIINHEKNLGLCGVRNTGIKAAHGDYIMIVDSDDKLPLNAVEILVNTAIENDSDYVESDFAYYSGKVDTVCKRFFPKDKDSYISAFLSQKVPVAIWGKLYKRDIFKDIDDLFVIGRDNVEDYFSTPILVDRAKRLSYTGQVTYYYRIDNPNAYSKHKYVKWNKVDDMIYCSKRHEEYFLKSDSPLILKALKEQKYWIKSTYYSLLENKEDRKRLIESFPENDSYVKTKPLLERFCCFLMKRDWRYIYVPLHKISRKLNTK